MEYTSRVVSNTAKKIENPPPTGRGCGEEKGVNGRYRRTHAGRLASSQSRGRKEEKKQHIQEREVDWEEGEAELDGTLDAAEPATCGQQLEEGWNQ